MRLQKNNFTPLPGGPAPLGTTMPKARRQDGRAPWRCHEM